MINEIIDLFYELSRTHPLIKSFKYDKVTMGAGIGDEYLPQVFLEEPIMINNNSVDDNVTTTTLNFDIVFSLTDKQNDDVEQPTPEKVQSLAHHIGLQFMDRINKTYDLWLEDENNDYQPFKVLSYDFITLRNWYDNNCSGVRCSVTLQRMNPLDKCDDSWFDPDKELPIDNLLPNIPTPNADGCVDFDFKLPTINWTK